MQARGIAGSSILKEQAYLTLHIPTSRGVQRVSLWAWIINLLRANILIAADVIRHEPWDLLFSKNLIIMPDGAEICIEPDFAEGPVRAWAIVTTRTCVLVAGEERALPLQLPVDMTGNQVLLTFSAKSDINPAIDVAMNDQNQISLTCFETTGIELPANTVVGHLNETSLPDHLGLRTKKGQTLVGTFDFTLYGNDKERALFNSLLREFPQLFNDNEKLANIPESEWLTIPLADDWESREGVKLAHKVYPMGSKDREFIDQTHDKLQQQGRLEFASEPTPFAFPVFVVWRNVNGEQKGRVVVDIRGLNKVTTKDAYPMPLQSDITSAVAGCRYITTLDATSFFHQFPVAIAD